MFIKVVPLSLSEPWSTIGGSHYRKLLISLFGWVAENEKRILQERIKIGIQRHKKENDSWGRPSKEQNKRKIMNYRKKGLTWAEIARNMNIHASIMCKYKDKWEKQDKLDSSRILRCN